MTITKLTAEQERLTQTSTIDLDMTVEGRKNHAALTFGGEHYAPQDEISVIDLKNVCLCPTPHRLLSRANRQIA